MREPSNALGFIWSIVGIIIAVVLPFVHDAPTLALVSAVILGASLLSLFSIFSVLWDPWKGKIASFAVAFLCVILFKDFALEQLTAPSPDDLLRFSVDGRFDFGGTIKVGPLNGRTVYNVAGQCIGFLGGHDPGGIINPSDITIQPLAQEFNNNLQGVGLVAESITYPGGLELPLQNCGVLDPATGKVIDPKKLAKRFYKFTYYRFIFVLAYSLTATGPERFVSYGILRTGTLSEGDQRIALFGWTSDPRSMYTQCCEAALQTSVDSYVAYYRNK